MTSHKQLGHIVKKVEQMVHVSLTDFYGSTFSHSISTRANRALAEFMETVSTTLTRSHESLIGEIVVVPDSFHSVSGLSESEKTLHDGTVC